MEKDNLEKIEEVLKTLVNYSLHLSKKKHILMKEMNIIHFIYNICDSVCDNYKNNIVFEGLRNNALVIYSNALRKYYY